MDDIASKLHDILNDPESLEKLKNMASMFGAASPPAGQPAEPSSGVHEPPPVPPSADIDAVKMAAKFAPIISGFKKEDNSTRLLHALRPFLSDKRQTRLDESIKFMQMIKLLPLIKKMGIF